MTTPLLCRSVYVHVPFCRQRCGYCDFFSQVLTPDAADPLVNALLTELHAYQAQADVGPFDTLYIGGGTPTVLPPTTLHRLLTALQNTADHAPEFTVEANPTTITPELADLLAACGVNRVSIGAQSFISSELTVLDRRHQPADITTAVATCRAAGLTNISLDLIFGIPGQTLDTWRRSLQTTTELHPDHVSAYGLTYHPGTELWLRRETGAVEPVDPDTEADMYELLLDFLPAAGLPQYEISNFARPHRQCRHNIRYWRNEPYLGIGPSAAGFIDGVRYRNISNVSAYTAALQAHRPARADQETLTAHQRLGESAMLALRMTRGIDRADFLNRFNADPADVFADAISKHVANGLLMIDEESIRLTRAGLLLANTVMMDFV